MTASAVENDTSHILPMDMIERFKTECGMNDKDWHKFCLRYSTRNISTILAFFEDMYGGKLPCGFIGTLKEELRKGAESRN